MKGYRVHTSRTRYQRTERSPKSPLKKGDFESGSPFFKGGWGGSNPVEARLEDLCVHGRDEGRDEGGRRKEEGDG